MQSRGRPAGRGPGAMRPGSPESSPSPLSPAVWPGRRSPSWPSRAPGPGAARPQSPEASGGSTARAFQRWGVLCPRQLELLALPWHRVRWRASQGSAAALGVAAALWAGWRDWPASTSPGPGVAALWQRGAAARASTLAFSQPARWRGGPQRTLTIGQTWWCRGGVRGGAAFVLHRLGDPGAGRCDPLLLDAARMQASPSRVLWRVALPLARPTLAAGAMLVFLLSLLDYTMPSIFGVNVYALEIFVVFSATHRVKRRVVAGLAVGGTGVGGGGLGHPCRGNWPSRRGRRGTRQEAGRHGAGVLGG